MKICWDNLENIRLTKFGNFRNIRKGNVYFYIDSCRECNEPFLGSSKKSKYCCKECASNSKDFKNNCSKSAIKRRKELKSDKDKYDKFIEKVSNNQKHIWGERAKNNSKGLIFDKVSKTMKETIKKMSKEERCEKFGWMNKLKGEERERKINEIINKSFKKFWQNATKEEKDDVYEKIKKKKMGERYYYSVFKEYEIYKNNVRSLTDKIYRKHKDIINPLNLKRSKYDYQLDHKFSITEGFDNKIPIKILSSIHNLEMLSAQDNNKKNGKSSITKEELYKKYNATSKT